MPNGTKTNFLADFFASADKYWKIMQNTALFLILHMYERTLDYDRLYAEGLVAGIEI